MSANLSNVLLYFSSGAAQVWAALIVFKVLFEKDLLSMLAHERAVQWEIAKRWWPKHLSNLLDSNKPTLFHDLQKYELSTDAIEGADVNLLDFLKTIRSIKKYSLITLDGKSLFDITGRHNFSPREGQIKFNKIADSINELDVHFSELKKSDSFNTGFFAIILNLLVLLFCFHSNEQLLWLCWIILFVGNSYFLNKLYCETKLLIRIRNFLSNGEVRDQK